MLEDKTTETRQDVPTAAPQHSSFRARLRSRWAQFQCVRLLRRHQRFRLRRHRLDSAAKKLGASPLAARIGALVQSMLRCVPGEASSTWPSWASGASAALQKT